MNEYEWRLTIKGGEGSGHHGHAGRPGLVGGSLPGGKWTLGGSITPERFESMTGLDEGELKRMFALRDYRAEAKLDISPYNGLPRVQVFWADKNFRHVGMCEQTFDANGDYLGETIKECHHELIKFSDQFRDRGLAQSLYKRQIKALRENGYDAISLYANITIGRYAWAKQGFDYDARHLEENGPEKATRNMRYWLDGMGFDPAEYMPARGFKTARDVATFDPGLTFFGRNITNDDVPPGMRMTAGKAFMLDDGGHGSWDGILWLRGR